MPDPTQVSQSGNAPEFHPESQDVVTGNGEIGKVLEEIMTMIDDDVTETKTREKKKVEKESQSTVLSQAKEFGLLESQTVRTQEAKDAYIKNPGPPGGPKLPVPKILNDLRGVPTDETGTGNPWLSGSLTAELMMVWFSIMPILMQIRLQAAKTEAHSIVQQLEASLNAAKQAYNAKKAEAKKLMIEAMKHFVNAGIQIGMIGGLMGYKAAPKIGKFLKEGGLQKMKSSLSAKYGKAQGWAKSKLEQNPNGYKTLTDGVEFGAGSRTGSSPSSMASINRQHAKDVQEQKAQQLEAERRAAEEQRVIEEGEEGPAPALSGEGASPAPSTKPKSNVQEAADEAAGHHGMQLMQQQQFQMTVEALKSFNEGVAALLQIDPTMDEAKANFLQQAYQHLAEIHGRSIQFTEREAKQAQEQIADILQAVNQMIQQEQAFRINRR